MKITYLTYHIEHASGEWEHLKVPRMFDTSEVASHRTTCEIWLQVPTGFSVEVDRIGFVEGPCFVHWQPKTKAYNIYLTENPSRMSDAMLRLVYA